MNILRFGGRLNYPLIMQLQHFSSFERTADALIKHDRVENPGRAKIAL